MNKCDKDKWIGVMVEVMESLQKNQTWELVKLLLGKRVIGCKWVYKREPLVSKQELEKFKDCLVGKGYSQQKGIDFSPRYALG